MRKVSLRNFQLKASKYLDDLPLALTRYGKVIAYVRTKEKKIIKTVKDAKELTKGLNKVKPVIKVHSSLHPPFKMRDNLSSSFNPVPKPEKGKK